MQKVFAKFRCKNLNICVIRKWNFSVKEMPRDWVKKLLENVFVIRCFDSHIKQNKLE